MIFCLRKFQTLTLNWMRFESAKLFWARRSTLGKWLWMRLRRRQKLIQFGKKPQINTIKPKNVGDAPIKIGSNYYAFATG
ncbi:hypothetical protein R8510_05122 [Ralstonia chuxiongensis]|nr:hypothetical protein R8510_05122 [Ralstonia chuxiongensis]